MPEKDDENDQRLDPEEASVEDVAAELLNLDAKVNQMVMQKIRVCEETLAEQSETIDEQAEELDACRDRIGTLEQKLAGLAGLEEHEASTAKKRREDLVLSLQRVAEAGAGKADNGLASMTYQDVLDQWATLNHGKRDPKQAYRAMEAVAEVDGITLTTNNDDQKVVRINLERFDSSTALGGVDNVNNAEERSGPQNAVSTGD